jgi:hypothetical protein
MWMTVSSGEFIGHLIEIQSCSGGITVEHEPFTHNIR